MFRVRSGTLKDLSIPCVFCHVCAHRAVIVCVRVNLCWFSSHFGPCWGRLVRVGSVLSVFYLYFSNATASAILINSNLSALLFNIFIRSKKKWAEAHFEISII